jgi:hypothetical protein
MTLDEAIQSIEALDDTTAELLAWCDACLGSFPVEGTSTDELRYLAENLTNSNN